MNYKISIIMPTFNIEKYLFETITSIKNQTIGFENIELVIVDDGSIDGTREIINNFTLKYDNCKSIFLEKNSGFPGKPRNIGIKNASAEYIMIMDHDDFYSEEICEKLYNKIHDENVDIVISKYSYFREDCSVEKISNVFGDEFDEINITTIEDNLNFLRIGPVIWTNIYRKELLFSNNIKFPEGILCEDLSFMVETLLNANGIIHLNFNGYYFRVRNSIENKSTSRLGNEKYINAFVQGYYNVLEILKKYNKEDLFYIIMEPHFRFFIDLLALSDINNDEKTHFLSLLLKLFKKQSYFGFYYPDNIYNLICKHIVKSNFDKVIFLLDFLKKNKEIEEKFASESLILEKEIDNLKSEIANIQRTKYWFNYKLNSLLKNG